MHSYQQSIEDVFIDLQSNDTGLTQVEANDRQKQYGLNTLPHNGTHKTRLAIFVSQFTNVLMILLIIAGSVSALLHEITDAIVIFITVGINAVVGFVQENKANTALEQLQSMIEFHAYVLRDGRKQRIKSTELVPGDILLVEAGDQVQADARIIQVTDLLVNEAALTGESEPVTKKPKRFKKDIPVGDRINMIFRGTTVLNGHAKAVIVQTGSNTEIGKIASLVSETKEDKTPLQVSLAKLSSIIGAIVLVIALGVFGLGYFTDITHGNISELFSVAVAIAVAAIPEGLVISLTVILAIGMNAILKRKALVRRLIAAETLGSVDVICTDKTGTITKGIMSVTHISNPDQSVIHTVGKDKKMLPDIQAIVEMGVLVNDAFFEKNIETGKQQAIGDTTDIAFFEFAHANGVNIEDVSSKKPRIADIPFSSEHKYMATLHNCSKAQCIYVKGAPEVILSRVSSMRVDGRIVKISSEERARLEDVVRKRAAEGLRMLALAYKEASSSEIKDTDIHDLVLVGFAGLSDPVRSDVKRTLKRTQQAGVRTIMITGDHVETARSIGEQIGLHSSEDSVFDGNQLQTISDAALRHVVETATIFARVDPIHKVRIVQALQANGHVVAMTGDGVNDAPAIKGADIGVALGSGSDVAKGTADMVLLNDAYSTLVSAIEGGRVIFQNVRKVVLYLLSGSFAEVLLVLGSIVAGLPLPALPVQILWINIVEDTFPNIALAFDGPADNTMDGPPRKKNEPVINGEMKTMIILKSVLANIALFAIFVWFWKTTQDIALTRTIVFVGLGIDALFYVFSIRRLDKMIWQTSLFSNRYLIGAVAIGWGLLLSAVYVPILQTLLRTVPLEPWHWLLMIGFGIFNMFLMEIVKWIFLVRQKNYGKA